MRLQAAADRFLCANKFHSLNVKVYFVHKSRRTGEVAISWAALCKTQNFTFFPGRAKRFGKRLESFR